MPALELSPPSGYKRLHFQAMSESKISCPHCAQHIMVDDAWAGQTINCPSCQQPFAIPGTPPTAVPLPSSAPAPQPAPGLRIGSSAAPPPVPPSAPARPQAAVPAQKVSGLAIASLVLSLLGCFFLTAIAGVICGHMARNRIRRDPSLTGGGLALAGVIIGYLMIGLAVAGTVKFVLDVRERVKQVQAQRSGGFAFGTNDTPIVSRGVSGGQTVVPFGQDPADPVSGTVKGAPFTYTRSTLSRATTAVLTIDGRKVALEGTVITIWLNTKKGESLTNRTWKVGSTSRSGVPTIFVNTMTGGRETKSRFDGGYEMELTTGDISGGFRRAMGGQEAGWGGNLGGTLTLKVNGATPVDIKGNFTARIQ
jgi:hypothetical protein